MAYIAFLKLQKVIIALTMHRSKLNFQQFALRSVPQNTWADFSILFASSWPNTEMNLTGPKPLQH